MNTDAENIQRALAAWTKALGADDTTRICGWGRAAHRAGISPNVADAVKCTEGEGEALLLRQVRVGNMVFTLCLDHWRIVRDCIGNEI